jgi:hypothetical protein
MFPLLLYVDSDYVSVGVIDGRANNRWVMEDLTDKSFLANTLFKSFLLDRDVVSVILMIDFELSNGLNTLMHGHNTPMM